MAELMRVDRPYVFYPYIIEAEVRDDWVYVNVFGEGHQLVLTGEMRLGAREPRPKSFFAHHLEPPKIRGHISASPQTLTFNSKELNEELRFDRFWLTTPKVNEGAGHPSSLDLVVVELLEKRELLKRGWREDSKRSWRRWLRL